MNWLRSIWYAVKSSVYGYTLDPASAPAVPSAEVYDEKQRYSAKRYVEQQRRAMNGDHAGRNAWGKYIRGLDPEAYQLFFGQVDEIIATGGLVEVLTDAQLSAVRDAVLARKDEIQASAARLMRDDGVPVEVMHEVIAYGKEHGRDGD